MIFWIIVNFLVILTSFLYAQAKNRFDIADVIWGPSIAIFTTFHFSKILQPSINQIIILCLVWIWALRLYFHIGNRFIKKDTQDARYTELLSSIKDSKFKKFIKVFFLQGLLAFIMSFILKDTNGNNFLDFRFLSGVLIFVIGFIFEIVSDNQLKKFVTNPNNKGLLMTSGLYSISRHPNYFGEVLLWWGLWILGGSTIISSVSPILITFLILFISGVPMSEKQLAKRKGFDDYVKNTKKFIPFIW